MRFAWGKGRGLWAFAVAGVAIPSGLLFGQPTRPVSLEARQGVYIRAYDGRDHRDSAYYNALCRVVLKEFALPTDSLPPVDLVFVNREIQEKITAGNAGRFPSPEWTGAFIRPSLIIMVGEEEADDTFMHEFMHVLQQHGKLFRNVPFAAVHQLIDQNEGLLLGSKSYLEFLKKKGH
ncbi:MAG: hypothetical protein AB1428_13380 [Bacteroidota bacterium]